MDEQNIRSDDYISLGVFKKILVQILYGFFAFCRYTVRVLNRGKLLMIAGLIAGLVVGYSYYSTRAQYFEVSMIARSSELTNITISEMVKQLNQLAVTASNKKLGESLNLTENESRQVAFLSSFTLANEPLEVDTFLKIHRPFKIVAQIRDPDLTPQLQQALFSYFNNNTYLKKVKEGERKIHEIKLAFINAQIANLDTLKKEYNRFLASGKISSTVYNNAFNPADAYVQSIALADQRDVVLEWLTKESDAFTVIDEFKSTSLPQSSSLAKSMMIAVLLFLAGSFLLAFLIELNKTSKKHGKMG
jgi:hypothetical protein